MRSDIGEMGDHAQKYVNDNDANLKNSFWKKNIRNLPGRYLLVVFKSSYLYIITCIIFLQSIVYNNYFYFRASPKKDSKSISSSASTSFDDFQESVSDAWEIEAEDEILRISGKDYHSLY